MGSACFCAKTVAERHLIPQKKRDTVQIMLMNYDVSAFYYINSFTILICISNTAVCVERPQAARDR